MQYAIPTVNTALVLSSSGTLAESTQLTTASKCTGHSRTQVVCLTPTHKWYKSLKDPACPHDSGRVPAHRAESSLLRRGTETACSLRQTCFWCKMQRQRLDNSPDNWLTSSSLHSMRATRNCKPGHQFSVEGWDGCLIHAHLHVTSLRCSSFHAGMPALQVRARPSNTHRRPSCCHATWLPQLSGRVPAVQRTEA